MPSCTICRYQVADDSATVCPNCGAPIARSEEAADRIEQASPFSRPENDTAQSPSDWHPPTPASPGDEDALEICDPGEFLGAARSEADSVGTPETDQPATNDATSQGPPSPNANNESDPPQDQEPEIVKPPSIQKLSEEQINDIRSSMMNDHPESDSEFATPEDASMILHNLRKTGDLPPVEQQLDRPDPDPDPAPPPPPPSVSEEPIVASPPDNRTTTDAPEPTPDTPPVVKTTPIRNIAYFHKNFIQLTGNIRPVAGEELRIDERTYVLRPKKIKPQYAITAFAILAAIFLFIIGKQFITPTVPGSGSIVGLILDNSGRPLDKGQKLKIPEIGKTATSDAAGFFRFDGVATGTYVIEYTLPDGRVGSENVSVADNEVTTVSVSTADAVEKSVARVDPPPTPRQTSDDNGKEYHSSRLAKIMEETQPSAPEKEYADLKLNANTGNAKLIVNGETLGRGNNVYRKLMPGTHSVTVIKDGFHPWKGKVRLTAGEMYTLSVNLEKAVEEAAEPEYTADDFYNSGATVLSQGDYESAVRDLTQAIKMDPSMADAYFKRAQANQQLSRGDLAEYDYVQAGEIYRTQKRTSTAMDAFNRALDINSNSVPALLNRADIYSLQDNSNAAMDDYQTVAKIDKENFRANFELGKAYFSLGKYKDADKRLRKAKEIDPSVPEVYHYLMLNYFARDDFNDVRKTYSDFKESVGSNEIQAFRGNPRYGAILRVIGDYDQP